MASNYKICDNCGEKMMESTINRTFHARGKEITVKGIEAFTCSCCDNVIFMPNEVRMIERLLHAVDDKPDIDVLNLDETAEYLRVSNQTIYNMIHAGRIKAYKVGREWRFLRADIAAYLESASSGFGLAMAAKGGSADTYDLDIIKKEIEKRHENNE